MIELPSVINDFNSTAGTQTKDKGKSALTILLKHFPETHSEPGY